MKWTKPDGEIEIAGSGCCCPPGMRHDGQHTNSGTSWARTSNRPWVRIRSTSTPMIYAECALTCREFEEALAGWAGGGSG